MSAHGREYLGFSYDVKVGRGEDPGPGYAENLRAMWYSLTAYRIDVVGHRAGGYEIIEVKTDAGVTGIGQLIAYPILWRQTFPALRLTGVHLVCASLSEDVREVVGRIGARLTVVG